MKKILYTAPILALGWCFSIQTTQAQATITSFDEVEQLTDVVNSDAEDIMPLVSPDGNTMYFVRHQHESNKGGKEGGHDIWVSKKGSDGSWGKASNEFPNLNNEFNNAVIGMPASEDKLFLLNAYKQQDVGDSERGFATSKVKSGTWAKPSFISLPEFKTNSTFQTYFVAPEGDLIIMAVNTAGTLGEEDLFVTTLSNGKWTKPEHMGSNINSKGFEMSPYLSKDRKTLYFSSNGHGGLGDADIFKSERQGEGWSTWSAPENLGDKINSSSFDAYLTMGPDGTFYFASNRNSSLSDIFTAKLVIEEPPMDTIPVEPDTIPVVVTVPGTDVITPQNIYFDTDKSTLREVSLENLNHLASQLEQYPNIKVDILGHTDNTAGNKYNERLSRSRANAAYNFLIKKGIDKSRLNVKYFGETKPVDNCPEGNCSTEQLQANRRVEFTIYN